MAGEGSGVELGPNRYGKSGVRVATITRHRDRHDFTDWTIDLRLEGDFAAAHLEGDNANVLPTDTMRGACYGLIKEHRDDTIEEFGLRLTAYLLEASPAATLAEVTLVEHPWERIEMNVGPHPHAFTRGAFDQSARVIRNRRGSLEVAAGVRNLRLLKTTHSGFRGYIRDRFTTLRETDERILATTVRADWVYDRQGLRYREVADEVRRTFTESFAEHHSQSLQHTLYAMGEAVLRAVPVVREIRFSMPNLHHVEADLSPYGLENRGEVFVATDRPYGVIEGTVRRGG